MKRNIVKIVAISCFLIAISVPSVMEGGEKKKQNIETVTIEDDNVTAGVTDVIFALYEDEECFIEDKETNFVMSSRMDDLQNSTVSSSNELREENHYHGWISAYKINAMSEPNDNAAVVNTYYYNDYIYYTACNDNWVKTVQNNQDMYIKVDYIKDHGDEPMKYTDEELYVLSHVIMGECGNSSYKSMLYVGSVVLNRVNHENFKDTIKAVVFSKGQYACTWDGNYKKTPNQLCIKAAEQLLKYGSILPEDVVYQAGFKQGSGVYEYFENHYYCFR